MNKKGKFYILNWIFSYGSASSNRLLAYANSAAELGYDVEIVAFLRLDLNNCQPRNGVTIRGLRPCKVESKVLSKLLSFFTTIWFLLADVKKEDRLLLYGAAEYLPFLVWFRRKQTYFEVTECPDLFKPRTYPWRYYKRLWKQLNGVFVISGNLKQYFVDYGVSPDKVHVINMIVDPKRFEGVQRNPKAEKYIAYCGNVNKDSKDGVGDLIASFVRYHEKYSDRKLYIIGPIVSQEQKQEYEEYLRLSKALDSVVFTDSVSPTTIPQYFMDAEMLVLARPDNIQAKYGFPTKLGEYLLSGRPVVLTDVGNITDFLKDGVSAFIAKPGDIDCISDKMMEVSANPEKNDSVAIVGKEVAMKEFNSSTEVLKIINLMYK